MNKVIQAITAQQQEKAIDIDAWRKQQALANQEWEREKAKAQDDFFTLLEAVQTQLDEEILERSQANEWYLIVWRKTYFPWRKARSCLTPILAQVVMHSPPLSLSYLKDNWEKGYELETVFTRFIEGLNGGLIYVSGSAKEGELRLAWRYVSDKNKASKQDPGPI